VPVGVGDPIGVGISVGLGVSKPAAEAGAVSPLLTINDGAHEPRRCY
jgi:hypothetical protein